MLKFSSLCCITFIGTPDFFPASQPKESGISTERIFMVKGERADSPVKLSFCRRTVLSFVVSEYHSQS